MPLNKRQYNEAVDTFFDEALRSGQTEDQAAQRLSALNDDERQNFLTSVWRDFKKSEGAQASIPQAAALGYQESATFGQGKKVVAAAEAALDPEEDYQQKLSQVEDKITFNRLENPTTYNLFKLGGYFTGLGGLAAKAGLTAAKGLGYAAGSIRGSAIAAGTSAAIQSPIERQAEGTLTPTGVAADVGLSMLTGGAVQGMLSPRASFQAGRQGVLDMWKKASRKYSTWLGTIDETDDALLNNMADFVKLAPDGSVTTANKAIQGQQQEVIDKISERLAQAKQAAFVSGEDAAVTTGELSKFFSKGIDEAAEEILQKAQTGERLTKHELASTMKSLRGMAAGARQNVIDEYGKKIKFVEDAMGDTPLDVSEPVQNFFSKLKEQAMLKADGSIADDAPKTVKTAIAEIKKLGAQGTFKSINDVKKAIAATVNCNDSDPTSMALKDLATGFRDTLATNAKKVKSDIDTDRLFSEYWSAKTLADDFGSKLAGQSEETVTPATFKALKRLGTMISDENFTQFKPIPSAAYEAADRAGRLLNRNLELKKFVDPLDVHKKLKELVRSDFAELTADKIERTVGPLRSRRALFDSIDNAGMPKEILDHIKAGRLTAALSEVPEQLHPTIRTFHDKYQKATRINGLTNGKLKELLVDVEEAIGKNESFDLLDLNDLIPEIRSLMDKKKLVEIATIEKVAGSNIAKSISTKIPLTVGGIQGTGGLGVGAYLAGKALGGTVPTAVTLAGVAVGVSKLMQMLSSPGRAAFLAEKYRLVPKNEVHRWARQAALTVNYVLPAIRGEAQTNDVK